MRLSESVRDSLTKAFESVFAPEDELYLFGSRVDDSLRGGDIDLLVTSSAAPAELVRRRSRFASLLARSLGDRKIDIVVYRTGSPRASIHDHALAQGVLVCRIPSSKVS
jgi:predicted nucleotidyltransferase